MPNVGIVIVNYNGKGYQEACLRTLFEMDYEDFEIILVDNDSHDGSEIDAVSAHPGIILLKQYENLGVAAGNNIGIRRSIEDGCRYTLLLNNDVEVGKDTLSELLVDADENTIAVPRIYHYEPHDLLWYAGGEMLWSEGNGSHEGGFKDCERSLQRRKVTYAPTCCMLIHNSIFDRIGLIDETYFMYSDDTDFCARVDLDDALSMIYEPKSVLWHKVSSSTGGGMSPLKTYYIVRNRFYFIKKYSTIVPKAAFKKAKRDYLINMLRVFKHDRQFVKLIRCYRAFRQGIADFNKDSMGRFDGSF